MCLSQSLLLPHTKPSTAHFTSLFLSPFMPRVEACMAQMSSVASQAQAG